MWWLRVVRRANWEQKSFQNIEDVKAAADDLEPAPKDEGGLSVFKAADDHEGRQVVVLNTATNTHPKTVDYLLVPDQCFHDLPLNIRPDPSEEQHPFLSIRHHLIFGLVEEHVRLETARTILGSTSRKLARIQKRDVKDEAIQMMKNDPTIQRFMKMPSHWSEVIAAAAN